MTRSIFQFQNIAKNYSSDQTRLPALKHFSLSVNASTIVGIFGPSGSGKTTFAKLMKGHINPSCGTFLYENKPASSKDLLKLNDIQLVHQNPYESLSPQIRMIEMLLEPLKVFFKLTHNIAMIKLKKLCEQLHIPDELLNHFPGELSGGERQRVALLRALLLDPKILICDEIVSSLDAPIAKQVLNLLKEYHSIHHLTVVFISHDLELLREFCDQLIFLYEGQLVSYGATNEVLSDCNHPFIRESKEAVNWLKS